MLKLSSLEYRNRIQNFKRYMILSSSLGLFFVWSFYLMLQSNLLRLNKLNIYRMTQLAEILGLCISLSFVICSIITLSLEETPEKKDTSNREKIRCFLDRYTNKVDSIGSATCMVMQLLSVLYMLSITSWYPGMCCEDEALNPQSIIEIIGSLLFLVSAGMFLTSSLICKEKQKSEEAIKERQRRQLLVTGIFLGSLLTFIGKVLCVFESKNKLSYTGTVGQLGIDQLPLGLSIRILGIVVFIASYALLSSLKDKNKNEETLKDEKPSTYSNVRINQTTSKGSHGIAF